MKTKLTREQSQHLIELGVPKEKASGGFSVAPMGDGIRGVVKVPEQPIFKLEDFLNGEILPKEILLDKEHGLNCEWDYYFNKWVAEYSDENSQCLIVEASYSAPELIDALYELANWYFGEYLKSEEK